MSADQLPSSLLLLVWTVPIVLMTRGLFGKDSVVVVVVVVEWGRLIRLVQRLRAGSADMAIWVSCGIIVEVNGCLQ